ncbi:MAG TPA: sigma-70 family RNA polymerase sigma factor, partial [Planctomycetota bacterium]|nr:sigma-70 family RNA polymerase sigma factor [Planctomycetota bacterium]
MSSEKFLEAYLCEINKIPRLTPEEEKDLAIQIQNGNIYARRKMIESNLRLVVNVAKQYVKCGLPFSDLIAEGNLGLITAVDRYDGTKKNKFGTYA